MYHIPSYPHFKLLRHTSLTVILAVNVWGAKGQCTTMHPLGGSGGMPPDNFLHFTPSEIVSGTFSNHMWFSNEMAKFVEQKK